MQNYNGILKNENNCGSHQSRCGQTLNIISFLKGLEELTMVTSIICRACAFLRCAGAQNCGSGQPMPHLILDPHHKREPCLIQPGWPRDLGENQAGLGICGEETPMKWFSPAFIIALFCCYCSGMQPRASCMLGRSSSSAPPNILLWFGFCLWRQGLMI